MEIKRTALMEYTREIVVEKEGKSYLVCATLTRYSYECKVWERENYNELTDEQIAKAFGIEEESVSDFLTELDSMAWDTERNEKVGA